MELQHALRLQIICSPRRQYCVRGSTSCSTSAPTWRKKLRNKSISSKMKERFGHAPKSLLNRPSSDDVFTRRRLCASKTNDELTCDDEGKNGEEQSGRRNKSDDYFDMDEDERNEWRSKIREVIEKYPDIEEEVDSIERTKRMQKLLADYPLVVEEDDPNWPEDADGWGFNLGQFFNKISIKNDKKEGDDENYDSENEIVWQDDDYIRPIKDITASEWEETVFKDISPLIILVHNRYKRPKENERIRDELDKAVNIIWNCRLPSPRVDLVSALGVSVFPELIFTKSGKILYREKAIRTADELSKIMAFFYYGAAKPTCLSSLVNSDEFIPSI